MARRGWLVISEPPRSTERTGGQGDKQGKRTRPSLLWFIASNIIKQSPGKNSDCTMADLGETVVGGESVLSQVGAVSHAAEVPDEDVQPVSALKEEPATTTTTPGESPVTEGDPSAASGETTVVTTKNDNPAASSTEVAAAAVTTEDDTANKSRGKKRPKAPKMGAKRQKRDNRWWTLYESLKKYHATHGTSDVPKTWDENPALARWCQEQRKEYQLYQDWFRNQNSATNSTTTPSKVAFTCALDLPKIQLLNELGFRWDPDQEEWNLHYQQLQQYIAAHGPSTTPKLKKTHPKLANWLNTQHRQMTFKARGEKSRLDDDKYNKLKALGWNFRQLVNWDDRFKELQDYYQKHGHFEAAGIATENPDLASWVTVQRKQYAKFQEQKKSSMTLERIDKLNSINFPWRMKETGKDWMERYRELNEYRAANGDCRVPKRCKCHERQSY